MSNVVRIHESGEVKATGKRWEAKLIAADVWGATAFYPAEVLARDAATAFPVGTKMYENHMTESEHYERPVGDVGKLIGKLVTAGEFIADHPEGPGVYADVEFYDSYVPRIAEIGEDVGLSVDGAADYVEGERDQRFGKIVTGIPYIKSVDVVTAAGAGGKLITIKESAGPMAGIPVNTEGDQSVTAITQEHLDAFAEKLFTRITEALTPQPVTTEAVVTDPVAPSAEDIAAAVTAAQAAGATTTDPEAKANETDPVEVDYPALVAEIVGADLPKEVIPNVVSAVQAGTSVEDAIKHQTTIREAFLAQTNSTNVRILESDRGDKGETPLRDSVLGIMNRGK